MAKRSSSFGAGVSEADKKKVTKEGFKKALKIFRFTLPYKGTFAIGFIFLVLSQITSMSVPLLMGQMVASILSPNDAQQMQAMSNNPMMQQMQSSSVMNLPKLTLDQMTLLFLAILAAQALFSFFRVYTFSRVTERSIRDIRKELYGKMISLPVTFFEKNRVGELMSRITSDVTQLQDILSVTLAEFFRQTFTLVGGICLIIYFSGKLTLFMLSTFPILVVAAFFFGRFIRKNSKKVQDEFARESGFYLQHELEFGEKIGVSYGIRYDMYQYYGPRTVKEYAPNLPLNEGNVIGERTYASGETIQTYDGWGPRASLRYSLDSKTSIKAGYNKMYQFIHLVSNTATIAPTDVWKLSDQFFKPQIVDQYSLGIYKNLKGNIFETSVEVYYKDIQNVLEYKDGARLLLQQNLETEVVPGQGQAYGVEVYVKKNLGRTTGWASYTYSRTLRRVITPFEEEIINDGEWFASNFDKPHDLTLIGNYKLATNASISATFSYSTGRPVSFPEAKFDFAGNSLAFFKERNTQRIPDFHRLDLSLNFKLKGNTHDCSINYPAHYFGCFR